MTGAPATASVRWPPFGLVALATSPSAQARITRNEHHRHFPTARRFAWKEYRTLRGFWLAMLLLGLLAQAAFYVLVARPGFDQVAIAFTIALATGALYAVGVASTTFSMEHEDETYAFLSFLPTRWLPIFAGKLLFAAASSLALAAVLSVTGWMHCGFGGIQRSQCPGRPGALRLCDRRSAGVGNLFFAAIAAAAAGGAAGDRRRIGGTYLGGEHLWHRREPGLSIGTYLDVLPARAAVVFCVAVIDVLLARRWLNVDRATAGAAAMALERFEIRAETPGRLREITSRLAAIGPRHVSLRVFARLLWQTWRQSWRLMFAMPLIAAFLCFSFLLIGGAYPLNRIDNSVIALLPYVVALIGSAVYASALFAADQRGRQYRFLAEHAAWPRHVWLSRLMVWSLPIVAVLLVAAALSATAGYLWLNSWRIRVNQTAVTNVYYWTTRDLAYQSNTIAQFARGLALALDGAVVGFALGQACSLFFRRAIVAGFAAAVCCIPLVLWGLAVCAWDLPITMFMLPLVLGPARRHVAADARLDRRPQPDSRLADGLCGHWAADFVRCLATTRRAGVAGRQ